MKRALKKKVQAELENTPSDDAPVEQIDAVHSKVNPCRMPKTAAMIGLAISMGATSLLVTRQNEQAVAAESLSNQNTLSTVPASDTDAKFASTKKADLQAVSSVSMPENPAIVEPTAISQVPRLEAKWQVAASSMSVQASAPVVIPSSPAAKVEQQNIASGTTNVQQSQKLGVQTLSHPNSIANVRMPSISTFQPIENTVEPEVNAQLKAQQEFALNRLQEKSNRLRESLAHWRSQETGDLAQQTAVRFVQPRTVAENTLQIGTNLTATEPLTTTDTSTAKLISRLKQRLEVEELSTSVIPTTAPTSTAVVASTKVVQTVAAAKYEVKPGDTLAAIALDYGTSVSELVKANSLSNPNQLQISQKLSIPATENSTTATTSTVGLNQSTVVPGSTTQVNQTSLNSAIISHRSVTVPTSVVADNQFQTYIESTTANLEENSTNSQTTSGTVISYGNNGVGGDTPVPRVFTEIQLANKPAATKTKQVKNSQGLRRLHEEIERLRDKYRSQQSGNTVTPEKTQTNDTPLAVPVSTQNNSAVPISVPSADDTAVQIPVTEPNSAAVLIPVPRPMTSYTVNSGKRTYRANRRPINEPINPELLPNPSLPRPSIDGDASQSLGSLRGTTVSPQLPPLAAVDRYLPRPIDETAPPSTSTTAYVWPAKGVLTSGYGWRWGRMHKGIDIANSTGTPIYAAADGVVEKAGWNSGGYGNVVDIRHTDGSLSRYGHNSKIVVQPGQQVQQGQTIALMGSTGFSTGPHSHFEIHPTGKGAVNPIAFLPGRQPGRV